MHVAPLPPRPADVKQTDVVNKTTRTERFQTVLGASLRGSPSKSESPRWRRDATDGHYELHGAASAPQPSVIEDVAGDGETKKAERGEHASTPARTTDASAPGAGHAREAAQAVMERTVSPDAATGEPRVPSAQEAEVESEMVPVKTPGVASTVDELGVGLRTSVTAPRPADTRFGHPGHVPTISAGGPVTEQDGWQPVDRHEYSQRGTVSGPRSAIARPTIGSDGFAAPESTNFEDEAMPTTNARPRLRVAHARRAETARPESSGERIPQSTTPTRRVSVDVPSPAAGGQSERHATDITRPGSVDATLFDEGDEQSAATGARRFAGGAEARVAGAADVTAEEALGAQTSDETVAENVRRGEHIRFGTSGMSSGGGGMERGAEQSPLTPQATPSGHDATSQATIPGVSSNVETGPSSRGATEASSTAGTDAAFTVGENTDETAAATARVARADAILDAALPEGEADVPSPGATGAGSRGSTEANVSIVAGETGDEAVEKAKTTTGRPRAVARTEEGGSSPLRSEPAGRVGGSVGGASGGSAGGGEQGSSLPGEQFGTGSFGGTTGVATPTDASTGGPTSSFRANLMEQLTPPLRDIVSDIVRETTVDRTQQVAIRLRPEVLGDVVMRIAVDDAGTVTARFIVDNPNVRAMIADELPQLRAALAESGLELGHADVETGGDGEAGSGWGGSYPADETYVRAGTTTSAPTDEPVADLVERRETADYEGPDALNRIDILV